MVGLWSLDVTRTRNLPRLLSRPERSSAQSHHQAVSLLMHCIELLIEATRGTTDTP